MASDGQNPEQWSPVDKFVVVLEAAPLNEAELAAYCRRKGLLVEQLERWRTEVHTALPTGQNRTGATERATDKKRIRELERDLRRKEKALPETAALLVLSRKYEALWTDGEDAFLRCRSARSWSPILRQPARLMPLLIRPVPN